MQASTTETQQRAQRNIQELSAKLIADITPRLTELSVEQRNREVAKVLVAILDEQIARRLPPESPAILTDTDGKVVSYSAASGINSPGNPAVIDCLRKAAKALNAPQLDGMGLTLHLVGQPEQFDASGAVYNYGPTNVHIVSGDPKRFQSTFKPVAENYWSEASAKRGMTLQTTPAANETALRGGDMQGLTLPASRSFHELPFPNQPQFVQGLLRAWRNQQLPHDSEGRIIQDSRLAKELMEALHFAAETSVICGGGPFAAAIVSPEGKVVSFGVNRVVAGKDAIAHGEVSALREALNNLGREHGYLEGAPVNLEGYSIVTSSITCISCAEQLGRYGIKRMYYENSKGDIESHTPFTEGPLRGDFWTLTGIEVSKISTGNDELRLKAFHRFQEQLESGASTAYLRDLSRA